MLDLFSFDNSFFVAQSVHIFIVSTYLQMHRYIKLYRNSMISNETIRTAGAVFRTIDVIFRIFITIIEWMM